VICDLRLSISSNLSHRHTSSHSLSMSFPLPPFFSSLPEVFSALDELSPPVFSCAISSILPPEIFTFRDAKALFFSTATPKKSDLFSDFKSTLIVRPLTIHNLLPLPPLYHGNRSASPPHPFTPNIASCNAKNWCSVFYRFPRLSPSPLPSSILPLPGPQQFLKIDFTPHSWCTQGLLSCSLSLLFRKRKPLVTLFASSPMPLADLTCLFVMLSWLILDLEGPPP